MIIKFILALFFSACGSSVSAQISQTATLHPDGSQTLSNTDGSSKARIEATTQKNVGSTLSSAHHVAVLNSDGSQEIRYTDASGNTSVIKANKGESIQKKYIDFLQKNHLPCGCDAESSQSKPQSATRSAKREN